MKLCRPAVSLIIEYKHSQFQPWKHKKIQYLKFNYCIFQIKLLIRLLSSTKWASNIVLSKHEPEDVIEIILTWVQTFYNGRRIHIVTTAQNADQMSVQVSYPRFPGHRLLHSEAQHSARKRKEQILRPCLPLDPRFADSNPADDDGILRAIKIRSIPSEGK
jgi:hypothetical protein